MKRTLRRWAHFLRPGHRRLICYSRGERHRGWYTDGIGRVYACGCGKRWWD